MSEGISRRGRIAVSRTIIYDVEVFLHDWLAVFKDHETGEYTVFHNDNEALTEYIDTDDIYIGFNSKHYDQHIIRTIVNGCTPQEIKEVSDFIIAGNQGWEHPLTKGRYFAFNNVDLRDDCQMGLSLKAIEGHMYLPIVESTIPFDLDRPLTADELQETEDYCKFDVDAAESLMGLRKDYLRTKINLGERANIPAEKAMGMTNAKITAAMLGAVRKEWADGRDYVYPDNLDIAILPPDLLAFFETIHDTSIPDKALFKTSLTIDIGGMPVKYAWGGVHGSLMNYHEASTDERVLQNRDVSSLYPALIVEYDYLSRNVPNRDIYRAIKEERITAKRNGDKQTSNDLKLPLNTVSGAQENEYNDLYDPLPTRSLRISGQLFLTVLAIRLVNACETIRLLNLNTDGILYSIARYELPIVDQVCTEWEKETRFELETEDVDRIWIKDVNNYVEVHANGDVKLKGGYLVRGMITDHADPLSGKSGGAFNINNNARIVALAIKEYFINNTPVEETVGNCDDIFQFQIIAKAGVKYREAYHMVDGKQEPVQKVNRVYATADERYGKLFKVKTEDDSTAKIEMLPEHCVIDNDNKLTIADVDKTFYIEMAKKRINDFRGIKPEKPKRQSKKTAKKWDCPEGCTGLESYGGSCPDDLGADEPCPNGIIKESKRRKKDMATATKENKGLNIYERLMMVRNEFAAIGIEKNGKNMQLTSKFFTLDDIVNVSRPIFHAKRLLPLDLFSKEDATLQLVDIDNPENMIVFSIPMREYMGNAAVTPVQAMGATVTYYRRYLYSLALDLAEKDELEEGFERNDKPVKNANAPVVPEQREKIKNDLTKPESNASNLQITQLKGALKKLKEKHPEKEEFIAKLAVDTQGFTIISKTECENILTDISKLLEADETEENDGKET
ncbi:MAG: ERF family protein [Eubacterium sp.]|jgi:hypothetical protein|nr:ERF family protein [Eubacterium sp.]